MYSVKNEHPCTLTFPLQCISWKSSCNRIRDDKLHTLFLTHFLPYNAPFKKEQKRIQMHTTCFIVIKRRWWWEGGRIRKKELIRFDTFKLSLSTHIPIGISQILVNLINLFIPNPKQYSLKMLSCFHNMEECKRNIDRYQRISCIFFYRKGKQLVMIHTRRCLWWWRNS